MPGPAAPLQRARLVAPGALSPSADALDASSAAFKAGYESPSQFSREYSWLFGVPPKRDVVELRRMADGGGDGRPSLIVGAH